ncbi:MAG: hypothetical protein ACFCU5_08180 [Pleurocapsa sp.]
MNYKKIVFSGIITALLGAGIGWVISRALPSPYTAEIYRDLDRKYALAGATLGSIFGCSQEALRQLKQQSDREEANNKQSS